MFFPLASCPPISRYLLPHKNRGFYEALLGRSSRDNGRSFTNQKARGVVRLREGFFFDPFSKSTWCTDRPPVFPFFSGVRHHPLPPCTKKNSVQLVCRRVQQDAHGGSGDLFQGVSHGGGNTAHTVRGEAPNVERV